MQRRQRTSLTRVLTVAALDPLVVANRAGLLTFRATDALQFAVQLFRGVATGERDAVCASVTRARRRRALLQWFRQI